MSKVPARWEEVKRAVEIRNAFESECDGMSVKNSGKNVRGFKKSGENNETLIFGNGDVLDLADAEAKAKITGADGIMLGRAIFGNPWLFNRGRRVGDISIKEKLEVLVEHTYLFEELLGGIKNFAIMKKHYKAYVNGWNGAKELRMKLMEAENAKKVDEIISTYLKNGLK